MLPKLNTEWIWQRVNTWVWYVAIIQRRCQYPQCLNLVRELKPNLWNTTLKLSCVMIAHIERSTFANKIVIYYLYIICYCHFLQHKSNNRSIPKSVWLLLLINKSLVLIVQEHKILVLSTFVTSWFFHFGQINPCYDLKRFSDINLFIGSLTSSEFTFLHVYMYMYVICICMLRGSMHYCAIAPRVFSHRIVDFLGSRWMGTVPMSIEVFSRPTLARMS